MSHPSLLWRAILRIERGMPWSAAVTTPAPDATAVSRRQRWAMLAAMLPSPVVALIQLLGHSADLAEVWPAWEPMLLQLTLVAAGALVVAALAFGAVAWRRGSQ